MLKKYLVQEESRGSHFPDEEDALNWLSAGGYTHKGGNLWQTSYKKDAYLYKITDGGYWITRTVTI